MRIFPFNTNHSIYLGQLPKVQQLYNDPDPIIGVRENPARGRNKIHASRRAGEQVITDCSDSSHAKEGLFLFPFHYCYPLPYHLYHFYMTLITLFLLSSCICLDRLDNATIISPSGPLR